MAIPGRLAARDRLSPFFAHVAMMEAGGVRPGDSSHTLWRRIMQRSWGMLAAVVAVSLMSATAFAEDVKVVVKKSHVCCPRCEKVIAEVLTKAGVKGAGNKENGSIEFTALDNTVAQKVLDDLTAAGFHGVVDSQTLKIKDDSGAKAGKVSSVKLKGLHNCCGMCNTTIKKTIKQVTGVTSDDAKVNSETLTVTGEFDTKDLIKALNEAGFHAKVAE
jgi:periplasmic mercuric ion binding protein